MLVEEINLNFYSLSVDLENVTLLFFLLIKKFKFLTVFHKINFHLVNLKNSSHLLIASSLPAARKMFKITTRNFL